MSILLAINGSSNQKSYIGWTPQKCYIISAGTGNVPLQVELSCATSTNGGLVLFSKDEAHPLASTLMLPVQQNNRSTSFIIAGSKASVEDQDVIILVKNPADGHILVQKTVMVRVRKNANNLTDNERDRFLNAYAKFNLQQTTPNYEHFLQMHDEAADTEIHTSEFGIRFSFLPWHRAYLLDLERQLQKIDASVAVPYWKFDESANKLFTADFIGEDSESGNVRFSRTNPLLSWTAKGRTSFLRKPYVNMRTQVGKIPGQQPILNDINTLALGSKFGDFRILEGNPHGYAHSVFYPPAPITNPNTAPQDPLFFLLHCNVDRLWALWQKKYQRYDITNKDTYSIQGAFDGNGEQRAGDYANDTMWPWNGETQSAVSTRPPTAPGGTFPQSPVTASPSPEPLVWEMIDYQGYHKLPSLADYDTIPYLSQHTLEFVDIRNRRFMNAVDLNIVKIKKTTEEIKSAKNMHDIDSILNDPEPIRSDDQEANGILMRIIADKNATKNLRLKAFAKVTDFLFNNRDAVSRVISILADQSEPIEIRRSALFALLAIRFSSPAFKQLLPEIKKVLRELIKDSDPELRSLSISLLASDNDEFVQKTLLEGLQNPVKAVVPDHTAIQLLALDPKSNYYPVVREILQKNKNPNVQEEAIHALSQDPEAQTLISNLVVNKNAALPVRLAGLKALNTNNPKNSLDTLKDIITDNTESNEMRVSSLSLLTQHADLPEIHEDQSFSNFIESNLSTFHPDLNSLSEKFLTNANANKRNRK